MSSNGTSASARRATRVLMVRTRWFLLLGESVISAAIFVLLLRWRHEEARRLLELPGVAVAAGWICLLGVAFAVGRGRWAAFCGIRHLGSFPPLWFAGAIGAVLVLALLPWLPEMRATLGLDEAAVATCRWIAGGGAACGVAVATWSILKAFRAIPSSQRPEPKPSSDWAIGLRSFAEISTWVRDDSPVKSAADDAFGHARIAARIASRLVQDEPPSQAVVGGLGSGKTTLKNLVADALEREPGGRRVRLVPVELWPYETSRAAVAGVIRSLIEMLSQEVSVLSLRGVPGAYAEAMSAAGGIWSVLARLQGTLSDPFESLQAVDRVATMIDLDLVVWIEDLERFAGGDTDKKTEDERLNPIRALLYGLDQLGSITVITATTTLHARFDIEKIARFVEHLPELPEARVRKLLGLFRNGLAQAKIIDPATPEVRRKLGDLAADLDIKMLRAFLGRGVHGLEDALVALCKSPRGLKSALRSCLDTWSRLNGEIDVDDVLVLSVLRESQPNAFALIHDHLHYLRGSGAGDRDREREKKAEIEWKAALQGLQEDEDTRSAVDQIVEFAFKADPMAEKPQGVWHQGHADYWERFLSAPHLSEAERDQPILARILKQGDGADDDLLSLLEHQTHSRAVEDFRRLIDTPRLVSLLVRLVERRSRERASQWSEQEPPGFVPLWRMWNRRAEQGALPGNVVWRELKRAYEIAVPVNLAIVAELEQYIVIASENLPDMLRDGTNSYGNDAKQYVRKLLVETYVGKASDLVRALDGAKGPVLAWITWGLDRMRRNDLAGLPPVENWKGFAETVLKAAAIDQKIMLPQIAALVSERLPGQFEARTQYGFSRERADRLFGDADAILALFDGQEAATWRDPNVLAVLTALSGRKASTADKGLDGTRGDRAEPSV
jgi:hypothetical protein